MDRRHHTKVCETRNVRAVDQFDMFDPVPRIAGAIGLSRRLIAIKHTAHRPVPDSVDCNLKPTPIRLNADLGKTLGRVQRLAAPARLIRIVVQHQRCAAVHHPVHEHFHKARR